MLSIPDMAILGGLALIVFGPDKLPGIALQAGKFMGQMRSTSSAFVSEMERASAIPEPSHEALPLPHPIPPLHDGNASKD